MLKNALLKRAGFPPGTRVRHRGLDLEGVVVAQVGLAVDPWTTNVQFDDDDEGDAREVTTTQLEAIDRVGEKSRTIASDRDIEHEQISSSTDEELEERLSVLEAKGKRQMMWGVSQYNNDDRRELQRIESEIYNRERGQPSRPNWISTPPKGFLRRERSAATKTAGGTTFMNYGKGTDAETVFNTLNQEARYEHGNGGYTGSIAEKHGYMLRSKPLEKEAARDFAENDMDNNDKWDVAYGVPVCDNKGVTIGFLFYGWASE